MIDLDRLVSTRAEELQQSFETWKSVIWSSEFQKLSAHLTDGEILKLIRGCESAEQLSKRTAELLSQTGTS